eukprot:UN08336
MDDNNDLIIDGYFRQKCEMKSYHAQLPNDIKKIIASYYFKKHSKSKLVQLILQKRRNIEREKRQRKQERIDTICGIKDACFDAIYCLLCCKSIVCFIVIVLITICALIFGPDIAGLIIAVNNDCNLAIDGQSNFVVFDANEFLFIGCSIHLGLVLLALCAMIIALYVCLENPK